MQDISKKLRILAPSGSAEQLVAAVNNGCDAVYLGLDSFNARMKAPNFTLDNLSEWVEYCHLFSVKVYVAINTSIKNDEFLKAFELLLGAYKCNVDGVIVTDIALMRIAASLPKPFDVVASTQLNIHDKYGAEFVKKCGATTVVCARECSFVEIREIASTGVGVECFLHGAMCVCQSGQCLFSSMVGGNSGNRGLCAQPCRKYYFAEGGASGYLLSARDMCSLDTASELAKAGATTFKIEGRNRRAEYAGLTSRVYRRLFNNDFSADSSDYALLAEMFNRGMSDNNYLKSKNSDIIFASTQNHIGVEVGVVKHGGVAASVYLNKGDGLKVFDCDKEICGGVVLENGSEFVKAQFSGKVVDGMRVNRTTSVNLCEEVLSAKRKLQVDMEFIAKIGEKPEIVAKTNGVSVSISPDFTLEKALKSPTGSEEIAKQLQKSGETCYTIRDIVIKNDDIFIAKSQINALRRSVLDELSRKLIGEYNKQFSNRNGIDISIDAISDALSDKSILYKSNCDKTACTAICFDEQQLKQAIDKCDGLVFKPNAINNKSIEIAEKHSAYLDLPSFADLNCLCGLLAQKRVKLLCNNIGQVELARQLGLSYMAGSGLNIFNDYIAGEFADADAFVYSRELTLKEIGSFQNKSGLTFVDGHIPLMQLCHCPYKVALGCDCNTCKANKELAYRDEMNNRFVIRRRQARRCLFELLNGNKLSVVNRLKSTGRYLMDYDEKVVEHYININNGIDDAYIELKPYTKGRLYDKIN